MKPKILLIDLETAPLTAYVWGLFDQNVSVDQIVEHGYVLCASWKWLGDGKVRYVQVNGNEKAALKELHNALDSADFVVHYNGTKFDIPTLNREFVLAGMAPPSPVKEIDLLRTVRKKFKFNSNKLDYVCQRLGLGNKVHHKGMALWKECMEGGRAAWAVMKKYNIHDVVLLEKLYKALLPWVHQHPNISLITEGKLVCPKCGSKHRRKKGFQHTATRTYQRYQCSGCGGWFRSVKSEKSATVYTSC